MSHAAIIDADGVNAWYGSSHVLRGIDFRVGAGETVGLLGRNGMGKSTLLRTLLGHVREREGGSAWPGAICRARGRMRSPARRRLCAGRARHISEPERAREPADGGARRAPAARTGTRRACWTCSRA
jgi:ATPase subunit of ABC transporter with duplicated ATPase domains